MCFFFLVILSPRVVLNESRPNCRLYIHISFLLICVFIHVCAKDIGNTVLWYQIWRFHFENVWKCYLNKKSIILSGTMELALALGKTIEETYLSLMWQDFICFLIASISAISPDASLLEPSVLRSFNNSWSNKKSGFSKQEVIVSFICSLFLSTMIMESSALSLLSQNVSDCMSILWHVLSSSKSHFLKREK